MEPSYPPSPDDLPVEQDTEPGAVDLWNEYDESHPHAAEAPVTTGLSVFLKLTVSSAHYDYLG